jgi:hypothetical protein
MRLSVPQLFAALPDAITAALFLTGWIAPSTLGPEYVTNLTLVMLIEFIVMHSSAFYSVLAANSSVSRGRRVAMLSGLTAFYLLFIAAFALIFHSSWPIFAFAWLFASRFIHIWTHPVQDAAETKRMMALWAASGITYIFGAILTVLLPLPRLGITPEFVASMHLSGSGEWVERPYTVLAFGAVYFAVQAWVKYAIAGPGTESGGGAQAPSTAATAQASDGVFARRISGLLKPANDKPPP